MITNPQELLQYCNRAGGGGVLLRATNTHEPSRNWSFFRLFRKMATWDSPKCKLSGDRCCKSSQHRKPKNPKENITASWRSATVTNALT